MEIKDDLLKGAGVEFKKSPNHSGEYKAGQLDTVIIHYTASPSAKSAIRTLTNPRVKASAHIVIARDGTITQLVPFNIVAWHAGRSSLGGRTGFNKYSIGIEMDNAGYLSKSGNVYRSVYGSTYAPEDVVEAVHRNQTKTKYWLAYTEAQIERAFELVQLLIEKYGIKHIYGHEEIAPKRKTDPGPAFPLDRMRQKLLHEDRNSDEAETLPEAGRVSVKKLNIRNNPDTGSGRVARALKSGAKVTILDEKDGWYKVRTEIEGWVSAKYIETN